MVRKGGFGDIDDQQPAIFSLSIVRVTLLGNIILIVQHDCLYGATVVILRYVNATLTYIFLSDATRTNSSSALSETSGWAQHNRHGMVIGRWLMLVTHN